MMSIIEQGGFQFKVAKGDKIRVPLLDGDEGAEITIDRVLLLSEGDVVTVGSPIVAGASVKAKVLSHGKDKKVLVLKKHRRKDYHRKNGHRQNFTEIEITSISA